jgi:hypothetical protein
MKMTKEAQAVADAIEEVRFDWGNMEQSHPHTIAVATLRKVVEELKYIDDYGNAFVNADELEALANELEELK